MKHIILLITVMLFFSCGKDKVVLLPEISHSNITDIKDVSAAYIFYDETKPDSTELNRRNLISTTNWLVNVDKRLTLKQVIPHITFLQEKKGSSSHKNENAKNYFTCNDTSRKNLGFIEFTDVVYSLDSTKSLSKVEMKSFNEKDFIPSNNFQKGPDITQDIFLNFEKNNKIYGTSTFLKKDEVQIYLKTLLNIRLPNKLEITSNYNKDLTFQEYISFKSFISSLENEFITISKDEFIY